MKQKQKRNRLLGAALALLMMLALVPAAAVTVSAEPAPTYDWYGDGTATEFYLYTASDIIGLSNIVEGADGWTADVFAAADTVYLCADVDMTGVDFRPIGYSNSFKGNFDGQNHTVSNVTIDTYAKAHYVGFFGDSNGDISNLNIHNISVLSEISYYCVGGLAGRLNRKTADNCHVTGRVIVSAGDIVGGLIGRLYYGKVTNSSVNADDESYVFGGSYHVGGIVGRMEETCKGVINCHAKIDVSAYAAAGGIVGFSLYRNTVSNCTYEGEVSLWKGPSDDASGLDSGLKSLSIGGIIGSVLASAGSLPATIVVTDCVSKATFSLGDWEGTIPADCYYVGDIIGWYDYYCYYYNPTVPPMPDIHPYDGVGANVFFIGDDALVNVDTPETGTCYVAANTTDFESALANATSGDTIVINNFVNVVLTADASVPAGVDVAVLSGAFLDTDDYTLTNEGKLYGLGAYLGDIAGSGTNTLKTGAVRLHIEAVNGLAAVVYDGYTNTAADATYPINPGTAVTLTAVGENFALWQNSVTKAVISTNRTLVVPVGITDLSFTAVFAAPPIPEAVTYDVFYKDGKTGKLVDSAEVAEGYTLTAADLPEAPSFLGWTFLSWTVEGEAAVGYTVYQETVVTAKFSRNAAQSNTLTIYNGTRTSTTERTFGELVAVTALSANFSYWTLDDEIISTNKTLLFGMPGAACVLRAVESDPENTPDALAATVACVLNDNDLYYTMSRSVSAGNTIVETGVLLTRKATAADLVVDTAVKSVTKAVSLAPAANNVVGFRKSDIASKPGTWLIRGYVTYHDAAGALQTVYTDISTVAVA